MTKRPPTPAWRAPMTISEINDDIADRWPTLITGYNLRAQLEEMAATGPVWWSTFGPKWQIMQMSMRAGIIEWCEDHRNVRITDAGRAALEGQS